MTGTEMATGKHRLASHDLIAASVIIATGVLTFALALRLQQFAGNLFASSALFVFPLPVACGLACGFTAPRTSLVWGVVWACILSGFVFALVSWSVGGITPLGPPWRFVPWLVGIAVAAFAAILGEVAVARVFVRRATVVFVFLCAVTLASGYLVARGEAHAYEGRLLPEVLLELQADYVTIPPGTHWACRPRRDLNCYELSATIRGERMVVFSDADVPRILGIRYRVSGPKAMSGDLTAAQAYLTRLGFRPGIVKSLSARPHARGPWSGGLNLTRLTLAPNGSVTLEPFPPFESRDSSPAVNR